MRRLLGGLAIVALGLGLTACGGNDNGGAVASSDSSTTAASSGSSTTSGSSSQHENTVNVTASGFAFKPTTATAKAGEVYFEIKNDDNTNHTFTIDGTDVDIHIPGGKTGEKETELKAGSYDWHCSIHSSMKGTLTVS
jgi:plastocyanin